MIRATSLLTLSTLPIAVFLALWITLHRDIPPRETTLALAVKLTDEREMVYLLTLETGQFRPVEEGNQIYWSPSGRYLGIARHLQNMGGGGTMVDFTVHDLLTNTHHFREYNRGVNLSWSPDETYLLVKGYASSGMTGSQGWIDVFAGDNSDPQTPQPTLDLQKWMMGERSDLTPIGWTADGKLYLREPAQLWFYDPITHDKQQVSEIPELIDAITPESHASTRLSPDGSMQLSLPSDGSSRYWEIPRPLLRDMAIGVTVRIPLPPFTFHVLSFAWQPKS